MPRYHYQCEECEYEYKVRHSMGHTVEECPECGEPSLIRVLPYVRYNNGEGKETKVGSLVKSSIEEAKRAIKEEKKSTTKEYKP